MKIAIGIGSEESANAARAFLVEARASTEVLAVAAVPGHSRLSAVLDFPRRQAHWHLENWSKSKHLRYSPRSGLMWSVLK